MTLTTGLPMVMISKDLNTNDDGTGIIHWLSIMAPNLSVLNYLMKFVISFSHVWISLSLSLSIYLSFPKSDFHTSAQNGLKVTRGPDYQLECTTSPQNIFINPNLIELFRVIDQQLVVGVRQTVWRRPTPSYQLV